MALKLFQLTNHDDCEVTVEVDTDKLTRERATEINAFWGDADRRLQRTRGDVVQAVVSAFALESIYTMLYDSGARFDARDSIKEERIGAYWSERRRAEEGWGGEDGTPHGWCGIRLVAAEVFLPEESDFQLSEVDS